MQDSLSEREEEKEKKEGQQTHSAREQLLVVPRPLWTLTLSLKAKCIHIKGFCTMTKESRAAGARVQSSLHPGPGKLGV